MLTYFKIKVRSIHLSHNTDRARFIMAVHSPMLRAMLTSDMAEVTKQEI